MFVCCCSEDQQAVEVPILQLGSALEGKDGPCQRQSPDPSKELALRFVKTPKTDSVGLAVDFYDGEKLHISDVGLGLADDYNKACDPKQQVRVGDYVICVNGISGHAGEMLKSMKSEKEVELVIRRPLEWTVKLERDAANGLGMKLGWSIQSRSCVIIALSEGPVTAWNAHHPHEAIRLNDRIIRVNDQPGRCTELLAHMQRSSTCELTLSRPAPL
mmetsp:Transcript_63238/g.133437  ORF Transcript_63238/g.133437 Transcript_63238/m.133437 type:complete len:216 (-) Transcript_63238:275-922(-)